MKCDSSGNTNVDTILYIGGSEGMTHPLPEENIYLVSLMQSGSKFTLWCMTKLFTFRKWAASVVPFIVKFHNVCIMCMCTIGSCGCNTAGYLLDIDGITCPGMQKLYIAFSIHNYTKLSGSITPSHPTKFTRLMSDEECRSNIPQGMK